MSPFSHMRAACLATGIALASTSPALAVTDRVNGQTQVLLYCASNTEIPLRQQIPDENEIPTTVVTCKSSYIFDIPSSNQRSYTPACIDHKMVHMNMDKFWEMIVTDEKIESIPVIYRWNCK